MKKLRNVYKYKIKQVAIYYSLLLVVIFFFACKSTDRLSLPVTYETEVKQNEKDGAHIDSLRLGAVKKMSNNDYLLTYSIYGRITDEYWNRSMVLSKIRLVEEDFKIDSVSFERRITLTPVQSHFFGKAASAPNPFHIKKEYLLKNSSEKSVKKIVFLSGDKEVLLELE